MTYNNISSDSIVDIRQSTIGIKLTNTINEVTILPKKGLVVFYTASNGVDNMVEGSNEYIIKVLARNGINASIKEIIHEGQN